VLSVYVQLCLYIFFSFQISFPSVTICSPGLTVDNLEAGFYKLFLKFLEKENMTILFVSAFNATKIFKMVSIFMFYKLFLKFLEDKKNGNSICIAFNPNKIFKMVSSWVNYVIYKLFSKLLENENMTIPFVLHLIQIKILRW